MNVICLNVLIVYFAINSTLINSIADTIFAINSILISSIAWTDQGLTLSFQARGPKRSHDKNGVVKNRISGYNTYYFGAHSLKNLGAPEQNLGAYAPGPRGKSNPD